MSVPGSETQTNNRGEIFAVFLALLDADLVGSLAILTDS
jgi:hypothetical protein